MNNGVKRRSLLTGAIGALSLAAAPPAAAADMGISSSQGYLILIRNDGSVYRRAPSGQESDIVAAANNARLATGLTNQVFLEVTTTGDILEHRWNGFFFEWHLTAWGFTAANTRLIAGLSDYRFLEIGTEGNLSLWSRSSLNGPWSEQVKGSGWFPSATRLITGLGTDSFLEVQANGNLSKWVYDGNAFHETVLPASGFTAALTEQVSGIGPFGFYELTPDDKLSFWHWPYDGAYLNEVPEMGSFAQVRLIA
jgi:hypothetical protein